MKKLLLSSTIALGTGLVLVFVAAVLNSVKIDTTDFNKMDLTNTFLSIGYIVAVIAGVIFTASAIAETIKSGETKKMRLTSIIITAVSVAVILTVGALRSLSTKINTGDFNLFGSSTAGVLSNGATNGVLPVLNQVAFLFAVIGAVVLIASIVAGLAKGGDFKKVIVASGVVTAIGLAMLLSAGVLNGITWTNADFYAPALINPINTIGYYVAAFAGVLLTGAVVVNLTKGGEAKRLILVTAIITATGIAMVLIASILSSVSGSIDSGDFTINPLVNIMNTVGYLVAILVGVLLIASSISTAVKGEGK